MGREAVRNAEQRRINGRASESHQPHTFNRSLSGRSQSDSQKLWRFLKCCRETLRSRIGSTGCRMMGFWLGAAC